MSYFLCKNSGIHHAHCPNPGEFCPKSAVKAAFEKKVEKKSSDDFRNNPLREHPFRLAAARQSTFPKGTAFSGGDKVSGTAQRRPLGGAVERSETEGVVSKTPPVKMQCRSVRRRSGIALLKIIFPLSMRKAHAERISNRFSYPLTYAAMPMVPSSGSSPS